jgi:hypothetical protein
MAERISACMVGRLLADRMVGKEIIRPPLIRARQPTWRVSFKKLGTNLFIIDFENDWDKTWIMEGHP